MIEGRNFKRPDGFNIGSEAFAELWAGKSVDSLAPVAGPVQLDRNSLFDGGLVRLPGYSVGDTLHLRLKVCLGDDFANDGCCEFSRTTTQHLQSPRDFIIQSPLRFNPFTIRTDGDPDACYTPDMSIEIIRAENNLEVNWSGGRLESAPTAEGPYKPFGPGFFYDSSGTYTVPRRDPLQFFRVIDPCIPQVPVAANVDLIMRDSTSTFWHDHLETLLRTMGEPSLLTNDETQDREVYRLIYLPSFFPPTVVRMERIGSEYFKSLVISGPYNTPFERCVFYDEIESLTESDWRTFQEDFAQIDFWALEEEDPPVVLLDGVTTFIEGRRGADYHFVHRPTPSFDTRKRGLRAYNRFIEEYANHIHLFLPSP